MSGFSRLILHSKFRKLMSTVDKKCYVPDSKIQSRKKGIKYLQNFCFEELIVVAERLRGLKVLLGVIKEEDAILIWIHETSAADPDPYVFGPHESASGSVSHK